jgi:NAD(P)-dependent dehydrogenase (short-subunit alcohol dehydrogenase family)
MSPPVAFIIGAGANVGRHTAAALKAKGYKVALGSRNPDQTDDGFFGVAVEAQHPESIRAAFAKVNAELGVPSVVIFNGSIPVCSDSLCSLNIFARSNQIRKSCCPGRPGDAVG